MLTKLTAAIASFLFIASNWGNTQPSFQERRAMIDRLAEVDHIKSEVDATKLVEALVSMSGTPPPLDSFLTGLKNRLAKAELQTLQGKTAEIPEQVVAAAFNQLVTEYGLSGFPITPSMVHAYRQDISRLYPHLFRRTVSGTVPDSCRPVEAVLILYLLDFNSGIHRESEAEHFSNGLKPRQPTERERQYIVAKAAYAGTHSTEELLNRIAKTLNL